MYFNAFLEFILALQFVKHRILTHGVPEDARWCISEIFHFLCNNEVNFRRYDRSISENLSVSVTGPLVIRGFITFFL